jgi:hypothetical protein
MGTKAALKRGQLSVALISTLFQSVLAFTVFKIKLFLCHLNDLDIAGNFTLAIDNFINKQEGVRDPQAAKTFTIVYTASHGFLIRHIMWSACSPTAPIRHPTMHNAYGMHQKGFQIHYIIVAVPALQRI